MGFVELPGSSRKLLVFGLPGETLKPTPQLSLELCILPVHKQGAWRGLQVDNQFSCV
jgi:hypothetical protein